VSFIYNEAVRWWIPLGAVALFGCGFSAGSNVGGDGDGDGDGDVDAAPTISCAAGAKVCDGTIAQVCNDTGDGYVSDLAVQCGLTCDGGTCFEATNIPIEEQKLCAGTTARLAPRAGAEIALDGNAERIDCNPDCGDPGVTQIDVRMVDIDGSPDLALFCLSELSIPDGVTLETGSGTNEALALFVTGDATIAGEIEVNGGSGGFGGGGGGGPGGFDGGDPTAGDGSTGDGGCPGGGGQEGDAGAGGGGAGYGDIGGLGGDGANTGGGAGTICSTATIAPLLGGSGGGAGGDDSDDLAIGTGGGGGGGAVQIAVGGTLEISGRVRANGGDGGAVVLSDVGTGGGGAGGAILLEANAITMSGSLEAEGGDGGNAFGSAGGSGASGGTATGGDGNEAGGSTGGSGGGGGGGRIRMNAISAAVTCGGASPTLMCEIGSLAQSVQ
jgi:hypothetical protein